MIKKTWKYQGESYSSVYAVRQAIWEKERKAFGTPGSAVEWAAIGVEYFEEEVADPVATAPSEAQMRERVLYKREQLLSASDYYVLPDYPSTDEGLIEVKAYRQALRDIPAQEGFPETVEWPEKPAVLGG